MSWVTAQAVLNDRFRQMPSLGTSTVQWSNTAIPAQSALYYATHILPATVQPELQGSDHETGIYQVSIYIQNGEGTGDALVAAQNVVDWFKRQTLSGVSVGVPHLGPPIQGQSWWHVPVSIPFVVL